MKQYPEDQITELKNCCQAVLQCEEGDTTYFLLEGLSLPEGCVPASCDGLLCPTPHSGYPARLFFSVQVQGRYPRNWNGNLRVLERNWYAFSWQVTNTNIRLADLVFEFLSGFTREN